MEIRLPAGVKAAPMEVAPKSQPMTDEGIAYMVAQKRKEAEELEAIMLKRQEEERAEQEERQRLADAQARTEQAKREKADQERQRWAEINAKDKLTGHLDKAGVSGFARTVIAQSVVVPMLVGDDLLVKDTGLVLEAFYLESPVVEAGIAADILAALYLDEVTRRWWGAVERARETLGNGSWLYTAAMPEVALVDAGPVSPHSNKKTSTHKVVHAVWGDCYIHQPIHIKE